MQPHGVEELPLCSVQQQLPLPPSPTSLQCLRAPVVSYMEERVCAEPTAWWLSLVPRAWEGQAVRVALSCLS